MKKLMIAVALVCAAVLSQAATINWKSGTLKRALDDEGGWDGALRNYNKSLSVSVYLTDATTYSTLGAKSQSELLSWTSGKTADGSAKSTASTANNLSASTTVTWDTEVQSHADTQYAVVVYNYTDLNTDEKFEENTSFYMATLASIDGASITSIANTYNVASIGSNKADWVGAASPVPEPFSGTLALLGMAGIALRRKMKKAKKA